MTTLQMELGERSYNIYVKPGILEEAGEYINLERKVIIVTDTGVPKQYAECVAKQAKSAKIVTVESGEGAKSLAVLEDVLEKMCDFEMDRGDAVVAVGGGVVGDLAGFAAACYMRGIDFYNIPTTVLSMVDSSIGGKTAVNFGGIKNIIGAFHQPRGVLIDISLLKTLPKRQISNGLAEAVKMSVTSDASLFELFEEWDESHILENIETVIIKSLLIKKNIVEQDEKETGIRKILNFGHTIGHGIEAEMLGDDTLFHGECVSLGMIPMCERNVKDRLIKVLSKLSLPTHYSGDLNCAIEYIKHDKKQLSGLISAIYVTEIGSYEIRKLSFDELYDMAISSGICKH